MDHILGFKNFGICDFPKNEFEMRWKNAKESMNKSGFDVLLLTQHENIAYFTGFRQTYYYGVCHFFILPKDGEPTLVAPISMRGNIEAMTWLTDLKYFGKDVGGNPRDIIINLFKGLKLTNKTVGVELSGYELGLGMLNSAPDILEALKNVIPGLKYVDASNEIWRLRLIKSPLEIAYIKKSVEITSKAFQKGLESLKEGMTEREFAKVVYIAMLEEGATDTPLFATLNCRAGHERYPHFDTRPTDRKMKKGDWVMLDGGTTYRGYWSDLTRQACIGPPSKKQRELYEMARKATEAAVTAIKPGIKAEELSDVCFGLIKELGYGDYVISEGVGHGLGLSIHEPPWLKPGVKTTLEPGMIVAIEPTLYDIPVAEYLRYKPNATGLNGVGIFAVENNVLVTKTGHEVLDKISMDAWIA